MASIGVPWNDQQYIVEMRCGQSLETYRVLAEAASPEQAAQAAVDMENDVCGLGRSHTCEAIHKRQPDEPYWEQ